MESTTEKAWRERLDVFRESGLTATEFGRRHGIHPTTLSRWKRVLAAKAKRPTASMMLTRMGPGTGAVVVGSGEKGSAIELVVGRVSIRVHRGFEPEMLRDVVRALTEGV